MTDNFTEVAAKRKAKYNARFIETDTLGRTITVMRLKPSEQLTIQGFCADLSGTTQIEDPETGERVQVARDMPLVLAASVREIDERPFTFPKSRAELNAMVDLLDQEGLSAVMLALAKANAKAVAEAGIVSPLDEAKNS